MGIAHEYFQKIFQYFKRLHNHLEYKGTGIGLGLCKKIIVKYDGEISVESAEGQGSTLGTQLPWQEVNTKTKEMSTIDPQLIQ